jgi:hypothetical protein
MKQLTQASKHIFPCKSPVPSDVADADMNIDTFALAGSLVVDYQDVRYKIYDRKECISLGDFKRTCLLSYALSCPDHTCRYDVPSL